MADGGKNRPIDFTEVSAELVALGINPADLQIKTPDQTDEESQLTQASEIIRNAILKISQTLGITINQGLENLQLAAPSQNVVDQFADILNALKGIAGLLDEAVKNNEPIEISGKVFDMAMAASVEKTLRVETFRIEMALEIAGISGAVAQSAAGKNNLPVSAGIVTALDPQLLSMPASQVKQAFGEAILSKEQTVETLFSKLAETLKGETTPDKTQLINKIAELATAANNVKAQVEAVSDTSSEAADKAPDPGVFGSKIMRTLLKIDTEAANTAAAKGAEKLDLSKTIKMILAKDFAGAESEDGKIRTMLTGVDAAKGPTNILLNTADLRSSALPRTLEESVMNQLTEKVQTALKTGVTEIRLLLRPESLGEMRVKLTMNGDVVMGKIYVESQQVKHIVESNLQMLKDSLAQHNLQTGSFDVNVGGGAREEMREMANTALQSGEDNRHDLKDNPDDQGTGKVGPTGLETGRRFGTNTIEFFV
jgi:flagellar hook-length control protein FliK